MNSFSTIIIGGGLAGLSTAYHLKDDDYLLVEKNERVGGLARTEEINGFLFDMTGHWLHFRNKKIKNLCSKLLGGNIVRIKRKARIYTEGKYIHYPYQANLYQLPLQIKRECLLGAIRAFFNRKERKRIKNYLEFSNYYFGEGITKHFIQPYNTKVFGVPIDKITTHWCERFVPVPDIYEIALGVLGKNTKQMGYNISFYYPSKGGIEEIAKAFSSNLKNIKCSTSVEEISIKKKYIKADGEYYRFKNLVSTIPLPELVKLIIDIPEGVRKTASKLRWTKVDYLIVALKYSMPFYGYHWIYFPEEYYPFYRIGCYSNAVPHLAPRGSSLYVEIANNNSFSKEDILKKLKELLLWESDIIFTELRSIPYGYVLYDTEWKKSREEIIGYLKNKNIFSIGRYGGWQYSSMEDAILDGIEVAKKIKGVKNENRAIFL